MRVVLVDNDLDALELIALDLSLEGHEIVGTAMRGDDVLDIVVASEPDVVVLDYRMPPGISGLEVARRLRRGVPDVRVLLYSNYVQPELLEEAERLGVPYLRKGDLGALRRAVLSSGER